MYTAGHIRTAESSFPRMGAAAGGLRASAYPGDNTLHIQCGSGAMTKLLSSQGLQVIGVDAEVEVPVKRGLFSARYTGRPLEARWATSQRGSQPPGCALPAHAASPAHRGDSDGAHTQSRSCMSRAAMKHGRELLSCLYPRSHGAHPLPADPWLVQCRRSTEACSCPTRPNAMLHLTWRSSTPLGRSGARRMTGSSLKRDWRRRAKLGWWRKGDLGMSTPFAQVWRVLRYGGRFCAEARVDAGVLEGLEGRLGAAKFLVKELDTMHTDPVHGWARVRLVARKPSAADL